MTINTQGRGPSSILTKFQKKKKISITPMRATVGRVFVTDRKRSLVQGNIFTSACPSVQGEGVCLQWRGLPPGEGSILAGGGGYAGGLGRAGPPTPSQMGKWKVCILLECFFVCNKDITIITIFVLSRLNQNNAQL